VANFRRCAPETKLSTAIQAAWRRRITLEQDRHPEKIVVPAQSRGLYCALCPMGFSVLKHNLWTKTQEKPGKKT
jgi:hypothetical protein